MEKVIIIGCPGSGKSTFARKLKSITNLPLYHLDMIFWNKDKTTVSKEIFLNSIQSVMNTSKWIVDGNYMSSMELRIKECDTVFFLDYPTGICLEGIKSRKGQLRSDIPWIENNDDEDFLEYIKSFNKMVRSEIINLLKKYSCKNIITFYSRKEAEDYLLNLSLK